MMWSWRQGRGEQRPSIKGRARLSKAARVEILASLQRVLSPEARESANTVLVRTLGALAWLRDAPLQDSTVEPLRYDFGPDPWARYRTVEGDG